MQFWTENARDMSGTKREREMKYECVSGWLYVGCVGVGVSVWDALRYATSNEANVTWPA